MTEREGPNYQTPRTAFLVRWNVLNSDGSISKVYRDEIVEGEIEVYKLIGQLKLPVETWRRGFHIRVGPEDKPLTDRGTNIRIYKMPEATGIRVEDIPPGWSGTNEQGTKNS